MNFSKLTFLKKKHTTSVSATPLVVYPNHFLTYSILKELTDITTRWASWSGIQYNFMIIIPSAFLLCLNFEIVNDCVGAQLLARRLHLWCFFSHSPKKLLSWPITASRDCIQGCGSGSGLQISLDPDPGPVSAQILEQKKIAERSLKVIYQKKT